MLESDRSGFRSKHLIDNLAKYPTKDGALAVAEFIGNFSVGEDAARCLRKMGPAAEEALIQIAPSSDPEISLFAIKQLGKVGTEKCTAILRKGQSARNPFVREAAKDAMAKVKERTDSKAK